MALNNRTTSPLNGIDEYVTACSIDTVGDPISVRSHRRNTFLPGQFICCFEYRDHTVRSKEHDPAELVSRFFSCIFDKYQWHTLRKHLLQLARTFFPSQSDHRTRFSFKQIWISIAMD